MCAPVTFTICFAQGGGSYMSETGELDDPFGFMDADSNSALDIAIEHQSAAMDANPMSHTLELGTAGPVSPPVPPNPPHPSCEGEATSHRKICLISALGPCLSTPAGDVFWLVAGAANATM